MNSSMNSNKKNDFDSLRERLKDKPDNEAVNFFPEEMDAFERLIFQKGLRIEAIHCHRHLDLMLVVLNNKKTIKLPISGFEQLSNASDTQLNNFELMADQTGVHWPDLDEDLSLRGFLEYEFIHNMGKSETA